MYDRTFNDLDKYMIINIMSYLEISDVLKFRLLRKDFQKFKYKGHVKNNYYNNIKYIIYPTGLTRIQIDYAVPLKLPSVF